MKIIIYIFTIIAVSVTLSACTYNPLPPKTNDASTDYILPKGELPTDAERAELENIRKEYSEFLNQ